MSVLGIVIGWPILIGGGVIVGVLFNKPIRALLQKVPLVGKYF